MFRNCDQFVDFITVSDIPLPTAIRYSLIVGGPEDKGSHLENDQIQM